MIYYSHKWPLFLVAVLIIIFAAYEIVILPDQRRAIDKVSDAIHHLPQGADKAELGDKIDDRTKDYANQ